MSLLFRRLCFPALLLLGVLSTFPASAQDPGSGGPEPGTQSPDPTAVPLDGGAALLLLGGAAYTLHQLRPRRRRA